MQSSAIAKQRNALSSRSAFVRRIVRGIPDALRSLPKFVDDSADALAYRRGAEIDDQGEPYRTQSEIGECLRFKNWLIGRYNFALNDHAAFDYQIEAKGRIQPTPFIHQMNLALSDYLQSSELKLEGKTLLICRFE